MSYRYSARQARRTLTRSFLYVCLRLARLPWWAVMALARKVAR